MIKEVVASIKIWHKSNKPFEKFGERFQVRNTESSNALKETLPMIRDWKKEAFCANDSELEAINDCNGNKLEASLSKLRTDGFLKALHKQNGDAARLNAAELILKEQYTGESGHGPVKRSKAAEILKTVRARRKLFDLLIPPGGKD